MKYLLFILLFIVVVACNPTVVFREPQPDGSKDLSEFPKKIRGYYMSVDDSSLHIIATDAILDKYIEELSEEVSVLLDDEDLDLVQDTLIMLDMNLRFPVTLRNDSVFGLIEINDTVFSLTRGDRLRKLKKNYFLNILGDSLWMVYKLTFDRKGQAFLCDINEETEMEIFKQNSQVEVLTNKDGDPEKYILAPTKKEFKALLKLGTFTDTTQYIPSTQMDLR